MADKVAKPKKSKTKAKQGEQGVLAALPSTRPERIGTRRTGAAVSAATSTESAAAQTAPKPAASKPAKAASSKPAAGGSSYPRAAKPAKKKPAKPAATRRKAAAPRTFEPTEAAEAAAGRADERAAGVTAEPRPRPVREGAPGMGTSPPAAARDDAPRGAESRERGRPSGVELVSTAVQAAGELTQIGLTIGGRIIKRAVDRLPKP
jgi:hypothetical protein